MKDFLVVLFLFMMLNPLFADNQVYSENPTGKLTADLSASQTFSLDFSDTEYYEIGFSNTALSNVPDPTTTFITMEYDDETQSAVGTFHIYWLCASNANYKLVFAPDQGFEPIEGNAGASLGYTIYEVSGVTEEPVVTVDVDSGNPVVTVIENIMQRQAANDSFAMLADSKEYKIKVENLEGLTGAYETAIAVKMESL